MNVKDIIKASGMTQNGFAAYYGIPWRTVSNWCRGVNTCPDYVARLLEIAEAQRMASDSTLYYWWVVDDDGFDTEATKLPLMSSRSDAIAAAEQRFDHYTRTEQKKLHALYVVYAPELVDDEGEVEEGCVDFDRERVYVEVLDVLRNWDQIVELMGDDIREELHAEDIGTKVEFLEAYKKRHKMVYGSDFTI